MPLNSSRGRAGSGSKLRALAGLSLAGALLSGCALLGGGAAPLDTFDLSAPGQNLEGRRLSRVQVLIPEPTTIKVLDGQDIVVKPAPNSIEFLSGAQWADRLPRVVQARLVEAFQKSGRFGGVGKPGEGLAIDYQVIAEIRAFEVRVEGGARAVVELHMRVLNDRNGVVRASRLFEASAPVAGSGNDAFVAGIDAAFVSASRDIVTWAATVM